MKQPPEQSPAVETRGLTKRFGSRVVVDGIDLVVPAGSVYGFLGPNGSGKTTTIRMLLGLITPTAGSWSILSEPLPARATHVLPRVGCLVEGPAFHPYLSGRANLARLDAADALADARTARQRIGLALERVGLSAAAEKRYRAYSLGMRQRLAIAGALLVPRDLLILDEPTNGLDPQGTREVRTLIGSLADEGATVLVSSHLLSEVEQVCTHVAMMRDGRLLVQGSLAEVRGDVTGFRLDCDDPGAALRLLAELGVAEALPCEGPSGVVVSGRLGAVAPEKVVAGLVHAGIGVAEFRQSRPSLEDTFVSITGEGFDVSG